MYIRIVLGFVPTFFFTSKYTCSFSSGVGYVMRPILLKMRTAFQSCCYNNNNKIIIIIIIIINIIEMKTACTDRYTRTPT